MHAKERRERGGKDWGGSTRINLLIDVHRILRELCLILRKDVSKGIPGGKPRIKTNQILLLDEIFPLDLDGHFLQSEINRALRDF